MDVIGYVRVSTGQQAEQGHSLRVQRKAIRDWAKANNYKKVEIYVDEGLSGGKIKNRPGLQEALEQACKHKVVLVVYSLSRATRSLADAIAIMDRLGKCGANFTSITEPIDTTSAMGKAFFHMVAVFAELERSMVSERTTAVATNLRRQGRRISSRIPYGYELADDSKTLKKVKREQAAISLMKRLRDKGKSYRAICAQLEEKGYLSKQGKAWSAPVVRYILLRQEKLEPVSYPG